MAYLRFPMSVNVPSFDADPFLGLCHHPGSLYFGRMSIFDAIIADGERLGLCRRRQWPDPAYESYRSRAGYACVARVNNREYQTDATYETELLARENAAMRAYLICRNFSVNDGMYPSGHRRGGVLQGIPVAIGTERRSMYNEADVDFSTSSGSRSGGSSPRSYGSSVDNRPTSHGSSGIGGDGRERTLGGGRSSGDGRRGSGSTKTLRYSGQRYDY